MYKLLKKLKRFYRRLFPKKGLFTIDNEGIIEYNHLVMGATDLQGSVQWVNNPRIGELESEEYEALGNLIIKWVAKRTTGGT